MLMAWNCNVGLIGMFGIDAISNFDLSNWLLNSLFNIQNPFAIYFWLVTIVVIYRIVFILFPLIKLIKLFKGERKKIYHQIKDLRKSMKEEESYPFKPLDQYLKLEFVKMIIPALCAILLRLLLGSVDNYEWDYKQLQIVLPLVIIWLLFNIFNILSSHESIGKMDSYFAPSIKISTPEIPKLKLKSYKLFEEKRGRRALIASKLLSGSNHLRKKTKARSLREHDTKLETYEMHLEDIIVSSSSNTDNGIESESRTISTEAIVHNSKELIQKAKNIVSNLVIDGINKNTDRTKKALIAVDNKIEERLATLLGFEKSRLRQMLPEMLNSIGPLVVIYAILPLTLL
jgi:hypothetical protein